MSIFESREQTLERDVHHLRNRLDMAEKVIALLADRAGGRLEIDYRDIVKQDSTLFMWVEEFPSDRVIYQTRPNQQTETKK